MMSTRTISLDKEFSTKIHPKAPFNFDATVHKPSHFPSPDNLWKEGSHWHTMNFRGTIYGVRMDNRGSTDAPEVELTTYSGSSITEDQAAQLVKEIEWQFDLEADISGFCQDFKSDEILGPVLRKWRGMRISCAGSLYELSIIAVVLQNATVRRTVQMITSLLEKYGTLVEFDGKELYAYWQPERLSRTSEEELRGLKVGYRAKYIRGISEAFAKGQIDERELRGLRKEAAKNELLKLHGIGPASVDILLSECLHHYDAFDTISPWEQRIFSKLLFGKDLVPVEDILGEVDRRWGRWRMLATHYLFEDLFWRRKSQNIPWLESLIRL